jgi:hypothetical protein
MKPSNTKQATRVTADLGSLTGAGTRKNSVSAKNKSDLFQFSMLTRGTFSAELSNLKANADLTLLNSNRAPIAASHNRGKKAERISTTLGPGTYYIKVNVLKKGSTSFSLGYNATSDSTSSGTGSGKTVGLPESDYVALTALAQNGANDYYLNGIPSGYTLFKNVNNLLITYYNQGDTIALEYYKQAKMAEAWAYELYATSTLEPINKLLP